MNPLATQAQIEYLATKVMGWNQRTKTVYLGGKAQTVTGFERNTGGNTFTFKWNPLTDWNHWRQVEEKVLADGVLWEKYLYEVLKQSPTLDQTTCRGYTKADLPTRVSALIAAHQELYS